MENTKNINLQEKIDFYKSKIEDLKKEVHKKIVGQDELIEAMLIALFGKGHILIEWVPGLAKTLTVDTLSKTLSLGFNRIQFTPDLLPSDLTWTEIYNPKSWEFTIKKGPIFSNFILADEINRAPSKVQSALLEAMAERQITIWNDTFKLEEPFIVLATQNPIEQAWTYRLPEAQMDRFMLKVDIDYAQKEDEKQVYKRLMWDFEEIKINKILGKKDIKEIGNLLKEIYISDAIYDYVTDIIDATRNPDNYKWLEVVKKYLSYWISPRWWIALLAWARVLALMNSRDFVIPEDIKQIAPKILSHRLVLSYDAVADNMIEDKIVDIILENVKVV